MDENLRETTELPESGGTAPNEENEPETKSIRFVPSAYDPRGIEQWLSERAAEGKLLLRYDDFVIGEPRDCRYHLEPAADDDDPDELLREKRARLGWEYVCRTKDGIFYIWRGDRTARVPTPKDCTDSYGYRRLCKKLRRSYFLPLVYLLMDAGLIFLVFYAWSIPLLSLLTMPKNDVIQGVSLLLGSIIGMFSGAQERKEMRTLKRAMEDCERVEKMPRNYAPRISVLATPLTHELRDYFMGSGAQTLSIDGFDEAYYAEFIKPNTRLPNEPDEVHQFLILRRGGEVLYFRTEAPDDLREHLDEFADIFNQYSELA